MPKENNIYINVYTKNSLYPITITPERFAEVYAQNFEERARILAQVQHDKETHDTLKETQLIPEPTVYTHPFTIALDPNRPMDTTVEIDYIRIGDKITGQVCDIHPTYSSRTSPTHPYGEHPIVSTDSADLDMVLPPPETMSEWISDFTHISDHIIRWDVYSLAAMMNCDYRAIVNNEVQTMFQPSEYEVLVAKITSTWKGDESQLYNNANPAPQQGDNPSQYVEDYPGFQTGNRNDEGNIPAGTPDNFPDLDSNNGGFPPPPPHRTSGVVIVDAGNPQVVADEDIGYEI